VAFFDVPELSASSANAHANVLDENAHMLKDSIAP
jgi:hypothetical protein